MGKEAEIILRIKDRRLFAAKFQETWKAGSEVRENEGITFLEHRLATKVCPRGSQGVAIALGPEVRKAWERAGSLRLTFGPRILAIRRTIVNQHRRPVSLFLVSAYAPDTSQSPKERGNNPQFREKKLLTAQRPRTYTHPTRPIKLLGRRMHTHNPPPPGRPLWFTLRAAFMFPRGITLDLTAIWDCVTKEAVRVRVHHEQVACSGALGESNGHGR